MASQPNLINYPTLEPECHDTEARSLKKINDLEFQQVSTLAALAKPGGGQVALTNFVYGVSYTIPKGADLLDVACYNPTDYDVWVMLFISPTGAQPGMQPTFPIRVYAHQHSYYEAMTSALSVPPGEIFAIAVSSSETFLTLNSSPVYLAVRHT
jgi:hypothetical protein